MKFLTFDTPDVFLQPPDFFGTEQGNNRATFETTTGKTLGLVQDSHTFGIKKKAKSLTKAKYRA